jgi:hypothetical protein
MDIVALARRGDLESVREGDFARVIKAKSEGPTAEKSRVFTSAKIETYY